MQRKAGRPSCLVRGVSWSASEGGLRRIGWRQGGGADGGQNHHNANTKLRKYIYTNTNIQQQQYRYKYLKTEDSSHKTQSFIIWVGTGPTDSWRYCTSWSYCTRRLAKILFMRRVGEVSRDRLWRWWRKPFLRCGPSLWWHWMLTFIHKYVVKCFA